MRQLPNPAPTRSLGFSLVELMVGIVVAMLAVIVVTQVFRVSEGQRRTTTGGDDAQTTGTVALTLMQRDMRQAGQGFSSPSLLDCQLNLASGRNIPHLAPATINPTGVAAGDANTDVLLIAYGSGMGSPEGSLINTQPTASSYSVSAAPAFQSGDNVVAAPASRASPCALDLTTVSGAPVGTNVTVVKGMANAANGVLFTLGRAPRFIAYAVRSGRLTQCDFISQDCSSSDAGNWSEVADGVVSLRAQYGRDTSLVRDAVPETFDQTTPSTWCQWSRVVAIRAVLVVRSRQQETTEATSAAPTWSAGASAPITLSGSNWKFFRYKTYETTVPLRNIPGAAEPAFSAC